jgi:hypothetical protein
MIMAMERSMIEDRELLYGVMEILVHRLVFSKETTLHILP